MIRRSTLIALMLLVALGAAPIAVAEEHGKARPIQATMTGEMRWTIDWSDPVCPVTTVTDSRGTMSHLGWTTVHWTHCPPMVLPTYSNAHAVFVAANGDRLIATYGNDDMSSPMPITIIGGTGRFEGATGHLDLAVEISGEWGDDELPIEPWSWTGVMTGVITY